MHFFFLVMLQCSSCLYVSMQVLAQADKPQTRSLFVGNHHQPGIFSPLSKKLSNCSFSNKLIFDHSNHLSNFAFFNNCGFHCEGQNLSKTGEGQNLSKPKFAFLSNCGFDCEGQNLSRTGKGQKLSKRLKLEQLGIGIKHAL